MSRSRKKTPILKDGGRSSKWGKQTSNRKFRRHNKVKVHQEDFEDVWYKSNQAMCSWDINDHVCHWTLGDALHSNTRWCWARQDSEEDVIQDWKKWFYYK